MAYSQARLEEAIDIIKIDVARRQKEQDEKYARTHYREDFHLRHHSKLPVIPMRLYHDSDTDLSDDDYDPSGRKSRTTKSVATKNVVASNIDDARPQKRKSASSFPRHGYETIISNDPVDVYMTFRIDQAKSRILLETLAQIHRTHINVWFENQNLLDASNEKERDCIDVFNTTKCKKRQALSKGQHNSLPETVPDAVEEEDEEEELCNQLRSLRNGKIRTTNEKSKTKRAEEITPLSKKSSCIEKIASGCTPTYSSVGTGSNINNAILIEDDDEEINYRDKDYIDGAHVHGIQSQIGPAIVDPTFTILTPFAHPINFKSAVQPCSFCSDYRFGILGYGLRTVTVARDSRNRVVEIDGGHGEFHSQTTMCVSCALDRMLITRCVTHHPRRIRIKPTMCTNNSTVMVAKFAPSINEIDATAYGIDLTSTDPQRPSHPPPGITHICSICPLPATHACHTLQKQDKLCNPVRDPSKSIDAQLADLEMDVNNTNTNNKASGLTPPLYGCGLRLCNNCTSMTARFGGHLDWVEEEIAHGKDRSSHSSSLDSRSRMLRADVEFLFRRGDLWRSYHHRSSFGSYTHHHDSARQVF